MKTYFKFNCVYCGQHLEYERRLAGRQLQCPACHHRIAIPPQPEQKTSRPFAESNFTWETSVPNPALEVPTRYRELGRERDEKFGLRSLA